VGSGWGARLGPARRCTRQIVSVHGQREQKALALFSMEAAQLGPLLVCLDALRDDQPERLGKLDDRAHYG